MPQNLIGEHNQLVREIEAFIDYLEFCINQLNIDQNKIEKNTRSLEQRVNAFSVHFDAFSNTDSNKDASRVQAKMLMNKSASSYLKINLEVDFHKTIKEFEALLMSIKREIDKELIKKDFKEKLEKYRWIEIKP